MIYSLEQSDEPIVLIVDDQPINIHTLGEMLSQDYQLLVFTSGDEVLTYLKATKIFPDLILLDIVMPDMDGYELCKKIKESEELYEIPIIFTTSLQKEEEEVLGFQVGAVDYIKKPFSPTILKARIKNHIDLKRSKEVLKHMCEIDALTQIPNRHFFNVIFAREVRRAHRYNEPIALFMIDIDFFKRINDTYGHPMGDECLRLVANAIRETFHRSTDFYARYGGEEFVAILPKASEHEILEQAHALHTAIETLKIPNKDSSVSPYLTISIGYTYHGENSSFNEEQLLEEADKALYKAKEKRNSTCSASDL